MQQIFLSIIEILKTIENHSHKKLLTPNENEDFEVRLEYVERTQQVLETLVENAEQSKASYTVTLTQLKARLLDIEGSLNDLHELLDIIVAREEKQKNSIKKRY